MRNATTIYLELEKNRFANSTVKRRFCQIITECRSLFGKVDHLCL